jgi:hypothetical protein
MSLAPAIGMGYYLWRQSRWAILASGIYLLLIAGAIRFIPAFSSPLVTLPACAPLGIVIWYLLAIINLDASDLSARDSGFPVHMRYLPVSSHRLAQWPMLYGLAMVVIAFITIGGLVLAPLKTPMTPVLIGATGFLAFLMWQCAITWWPSPILFGRFIAFIVINLVLGGLGAGAMKLDIPVAYVCLAYFALAALAFPAAARGVSLARRGDGQTWPLRLPSITIRRGKSHPFRSPASAMLWLEFRRNLILTPLLAIGMCLFVFALFLLNRQLAQKQGTVNLVPSSPVEITSTLIILATLIGSPTLFFMMMSGNLGKFDFFSKDVGFPSFALVRPVASSTIIFVKLRGIGLTVLVTAAVVFTIAAIVLLLAPASDIRTIRTLVATAGAPTSIVLILVILSWMALQWRNCAVGMLASLTGRKWVLLSITYAHMGLFALAGFSTFWLLRHRSYLPSLTALVPWLMIALVIMKLALSVFIIRILNDRTLLSPRALLMSIATWLLLAIISLSVLLAIVPPHWQNLALIALLIPFNRLIVAPLAMDWNRHR